jgi:hypothetical protein
VAFCAGSYFIGKKLIDYDDDLFENIYIATFVGAFILMLLTLIVGLIITCFYHLSLEILK